jgi:hypothetical protein
MRFAHLILAASVALALSHLVTPAWANDNPAILAPADGATVSSPVTVVVSPSAGAMTTAVQGGGMNMEAGSHLHLLVDSPLPKPGSAVPMDARHIHLMHGESKVNVPLAPGRHTLQLLMGAPGHLVPPNPRVSEIVTINVR